jgi:hypothetical protein
MSEISSNRSSSRIRVVAQSRNPKDTAQEPSARKTRISSGAVYGVKCVPC